LTRFIRKCLIAAGYVLVLLGSAQAQSVNIGETAVLSAADGQNANLLLAQVATLSKAATVQSLSFYVTAASGNLILGIYDATGPSGGPGALRASTASFATKTGWNTAKVVTPVSLAAGSYWLAYLPSSNALSFVKTNATGNCKYYSLSFGSLPKTFNTSPASCNPTTWSFYATATVSSSAVNGACGPSNGATVSAKPTANLCTAGTASTVSGSGPWSWTCAGSGGGSTASCSDKLASTASSAVNGACGSSNGATVSAEPTANLCTAGTASAVSGSGPWSWSCAGSNGGSTATCSDKLASTGATGSSGSTPASGSTPFVALHTYYMSPTGSDSNNGTSAATPWATPNHSQIVCGDVIIAAAGTYTGNGFDVSTQPTNCPSVSGGLAASPGGIYFAIVLCGGSSVGDCKIPYTGAAPSAAISVDNVNNWAFEGWSVSNTSCCASPHDGRGYVAFADASPTIRTHHVAFINDIAAGSGQGYQTDEGGNNHNAPGNGVDYFAVIGSIAQNATNWGQCVGALDVVAPAVWDTNAGTHIYINGNILWNNLSPQCITQFDGEGLYGDTWNAHGYNQKAVYSNNISWSATRSGLKMTFDATEKPSDIPTVSWYNNTLFQNDTNTGTDNANGELQMDGTAGPGFHLTVTNNIAYQPLKTSGEGSAIYGSSLQFGFWSNVTLGISGNENIITASGSTCTMGECNSTFDYGNDAGNAVGTNFFHENPLFANTSDLLSDRMGAPNCSGFANVTSCMGWNANTSTLTPLTPIADLVPSSAHSSGKGYQRPSTTCVNSGPIFNDYPIWLKGVVYLQWNGSALTENSGLITKPCNM
jgi:hypothetical protein